MAASEIKVEIARPTPSGSWGFRWQKNDTRSDSYAANLSVSASYAPTYAPQVPAETDESRPHRFDIQYLPVGAHSAADEKCFTLDRAGAERLLRALGDALSWDGK